jgi:hypothetical protein
LLYRIAKPVTTWGGQLEIISTHRGSGTVFNEIIRDIKEKGNKMGWSHHRVTIQDAVEGWDRGEDQRENGDAPKRAKITSPGSKRNASMKSSGYRNIIAFPRTIPRRLSAMK